MTLRHCVLLSSFGLVQRGIRNCLLLLLLLTLWLQSALGQIVGKETVASVCASLLVSIGTMSYFSCFLCLVVLILQN